MIGVLRVIQRGVMITVAVAATSCAALFPSLEDDPHFGDYFTVRSGGQSQQVKLDGPRLYGPEVEVSHLADGYRGNVNGNVVDLRSDGQKIEGSVGSGRTELYVSETPDALVVRGLYGGKLGEVKLAHATFRGTIGACQFDLRRPTRESVWYEGTYACRDSIRSARIALPKSLGQRPADECAVFLAVVFGR